MRKTIKELGGNMPENLPTPEKSVKKIEKEISKKNIINSKYIEKESNDNK